MPANVIAIGQPVNENERVSIGYLRDHLPNTCTILHNFEIDVRGMKMEIDAAILTPHSVILVDFKGTGGRIDAYGSKWIPEGRAEFTTPLLKLRGHARVLRGLLTDRYPNDQGLRGVYVDAVVVLSGRDPDFVDHDGNDESDVCTLANAPQCLMDAGRVPSNRSANIAGHHGKVRKLIQGTARPRDAKQQYGNWLVTERLTQADAYTDYRAENAFAKKAGGTVLLRVFRADPYVTAEARKEQRDRLDNAYISLTQMPPHPGIVGARDYFPTEGEDRFVLVMEDPRGRTLGLQLKKRSEVLTPDQKFRIARDILSALGHAHAHRVIHRNLTPGTVILTPNGQARLTGFEYARTGADRSATFGEEIVRLVDEHYAAPELTLDSANATAASDIFSAGAVLYELFTGVRPYSGQTEIVDRSAIFAAKPSSIAPDLPAGFDEWLQGLCAFNADERPSCEEAQRMLDDLLRTTAPVPPMPAKKREETRSQLALDFTNLPEGFEFSGKLRVEERLGEPGAFGVVYRMYDSLADMNRAVKLIISDSESLIERLKTEYQTLLRLQDHHHEHVVRVIEAQPNQGMMPPHIVFEYVEGKDLGEMYADNALTRRDVWQMGTQVAEGLVHLHKHGIYHCDIKPRNLLWTEMKTDSGTEKGVKIIDFNVAVRANEATGGRGGTMRYIPPDCVLGTESTAQELLDRDTYALVLTIYEGVTGQYPWESASPPSGKKPRDPRELAGLEELSAKEAEVLLKGLSPQRKDRFQCAEELLQALNSLWHTGQGTEATPVNTQDQLDAPLQGNQTLPKADPSAAAPESSRPPSATPPPAQEVEVIVESAAHPSPAPDPEPVAPRLPTATDLFLLRSAQLGHQLAPPAIAQSPNAEAPDWAADVAAEAIFVSQAKENLVQLAGHILADADRSCALERVDFDSGNVAATARDLGLPALPLGPAGSYLRAAILARRHGAMYQINFVSLLPWCFARGSNPVHRATLEIGRLSRPHAPPGYLVLLLDGAGYEAAIPPDWQAVLAGGNVVLRHSANPSAVCHNLANETSLPLWALLTQPHPEVTITNLVRQLSTHPGVLHGDVMPLAKIAREFNIPRAAGVGLARTLCQQHPSQFAVKTDRELGDYLQKLK